MDRPCVNIELQPMLQDYLLHEFGGKPNDTGVMINSSSDIGEMIQSMISVKDRPPKQEIKDYPFTIFLPVNDWNHYVFRENFIYIPEWKQKLLVKYIESSFRIRVREFFVAGYEKKYTQDAIINAFLSAYNIRHSKINYDAIKKYDYRNRKRTEREIRDIIAANIDI